MPFRPANQAPSGDDIYCAILGFLSNRSTRNCYHNVGGPEPEQEDRRRKMVAFYGKTRVEETDFLSGLVLDQASESGPALKDTPPRSYTPDDEARVLKRFEQTLSHLDIDESLVDTSEPDRLAAVSVLEDIEPISRDIGVSPDKIRAVLRDKGIIE